MVEISFNELRKVQLQERKLGALTRLEESFYDDYKRFVENLKKEAANGGMDSIRALENSVSVLESIVELRQQKILLKSLKDLRSGNVNSDGLAREEKELYTQLIRLLNDAGKQLLDGVKREAPAVKKPSGVVSLKITAALPQFVGPDAQTYGPFTQGQVIEVAKAPADLLVKRKVAVVLNDG
ncbi:MAG: hypothetical protein V1834_01725 [Candidatus Micrarchaeota archaeon]